MNVANSDIRDGGSMTGLVSIVVPVYKVEKYFERCIQSIVAQSYGNIEIILVDDGSPDSCPVMCDQWAEKDARIQVIHKKNGGLSDARNAGIQIARGEYIAFVDSDDYIHPQFIELLYGIMMQQQADVVACEYEEVSADSVLNVTERICRDDVRLKELPGYTPTAIAFNVWNKLYKRELFDFIRFPVGKIHEDVGIWWELLYYAKNIVAIPEKLYYYCQNPASIMRVEYGMQHMDLAEVIYLQYCQFKELPDDLYASIVLKACLDIYPNLYEKLIENPRFSKADKRTFLRSYREKLAVAKNDKNIRKIEKIKHWVYSRVPRVMVAIYKRREQARKREIP